MNSKKNKNKNRLNKPPNPQPPQKIDTFVNIKNENSKNINETESIPNEERVPEIIGEKNTAEVVESPKKPKRNKEEKTSECNAKEIPKSPDILRKEDSDTQEEIIYEEIKEIDIQATKTNPTSVIIPVSRKKKNKKKKHGDKQTEDQSHKLTEDQSHKHTEDQSQVVERIEDTKVVDEVTFFEDENTIKVLEKKETACLKLSDDSKVDVKSSKKKNKKKKNRNDSEKSDRSDVYSPVQKHIESSEPTLSGNEKQCERKIEDPDIHFTKEQIEITTSSDRELLKEVVAIKAMNETQHTSTSNEKPDFTKMPPVPMNKTEILNEKLKSKHKKDRKLCRIEQEQTLSNSETRIETLDIKPELSISLEQEPHSVNENIVIEKISKPSTMIAKPEGKKNKDKNKYPEDESIVAIESIKPEEYVKLKDNVNQDSQMKKKTFSKDVTDDKHEISSLVNIDPELTDKTIYSTSHIQTEAASSISVKEQEKKSIEKVDLKKKEIITPEPFKKVTKSEDQIHKDINVKREDKADSMPRLISLEELDITSLKIKESEVSELKIAPENLQDLSAQSMDANNNTGIEEIIASPDIKIKALDIPAITDFGEILEPLYLQDSRSKPKKPKNEIKIKNEEKTDLKSKVIEVNQDMKELKLSIEKSLAELTALETTDLDSEKKMEEKFNSNLSLKEKQETFEGFKPFSETMPTTSADVIKEQSHKIERNESFLEKEHLQENDSLSKSNEFPIGIEDNLLANLCITQSKSVNEAFEENVRIVESELKLEESKNTDAIDSAQPPICPARRDNKSKNKSKKKSKQQSQQETNVTDKSTSNTQQQTKTGCAQDSDKTETAQEATKSEKTDQQQADCKDISEQQKETTEEVLGQKEVINQNSGIIIDDILQNVSENIENFEDALTTSADDINKTFELIASEVNDSIDTSQNPEINIIAPDEDTDKDNKQEKINPVSQPKNLLGHPSIPVSSNKTDYKRERNKTPNTEQAKVKIKDCVEIEIDETKKQSKESQTDNKQKILKNNAVKETISCVTNGNEEYVYKYSFRKVFLTSACDICKTNLKMTRVPCSFCKLVFYCNQKHRDEDWPQHQALCFAVSTIAHLKGHKHIYADTQGVVGHSYRLLRMQTIISCEKVLKRKLLPWEQEALLYPRMCADSNCREWHQSKLKDCDGCGQISYCSSSPAHLPKSHQRWCKSYALYQKLVSYQQTKGRLEPKLPTRVITDLNYKVPEKLNEILAFMYEEKIDMDDMQYAAVTQLATAPLTAVYGCQIFNNNHPKTTNNKVTHPFTIHIVGAELQFEADVLNKWEVFFLHLRPDLKDIRVVLISPDLNPCNLPLELLRKPQLCGSCTQNKRRILYDFQDKMNYFDYWSSDDYVTPDLVCAFNANIQRSSTYNGKDPWPLTINSVLKAKIPFVITSYTLEELKRDLERVKECASIDYKVIAEPKVNSFASVRPDRNFISDDEMPLLFKNYCFMVVCGGF